MNLVLRRLVFVFSFVLFVFSRFALAERLVIPFDRDLQARAVTVLGHTDPGSREIAFPLVARVI